MRSGTALLPATILAALSLAAPFATAQPFTYQGQLTVGGLPATSAQDFEFRVFNAATAGAQVGSTTTVLNVTPTNGVFTATVSPGNGVFTGADRWLEVAARPAGSGAYTTLTPRQPITAAPYAARSLSERMTDNGAGGLSNDSAQVQRLLWNTSAPITGADYFTLRTPTAAAQFGGMYVDTAAADGRPFYGFATSGLLKSYVYYQPSSSSVILWNNGDNVRINNAGQVGLGLVPTGTDRLQVVGSISATDTIKTTTLSATGNATAAEFVYPAPRPRTLILPGLEFHSVTDGVTRKVTTQTGVVGFDASVGFAGLQKAFQLPVGAVLTGLTLWVQDNLAGNDMQFTLARRDLGEIAASALISTNLAVPVGTITPVTYTIPTAQLPTSDSEYYYLTFSSSDWNGSSHGLAAVQIYYTMPGPQ